MKLPKNYSAKLPSRCVACGDERPHERMLVGIASRFFAFLNSAPAFAVEMPICHICHADIRRNRVIRRVGFGVYLGVVVASALYCYIVYPDLFDRWTVNLAALVATLPGVFFLYLLDDPVRLIVDNSTVTYRFVNPEVAAEFEALNQSFLEDASGPLDARPDG